MSNYFINKLETTRFDQETGEVIAEQTVSTSVVKKPHDPCFFAYSRGLEPLYGMRIFNTTARVMLKLMDFLEWNTGKIYMTQKRMEELLFCCGISKRSYYRALNELSKAGVIDVDRSTITVNESMFWKGESKARQELLMQKGMN